MYMMLRLGICEEGEEGGEVASNASLLSNPSTGMVRTNRSASTGLVHVIRHPVQATKSTGSSHSHLPQTYSAVRMIRPRHAVVSPDVCRRYEQHQRFVTRSRRSASCSSSEASDDEENKRLSLITSKYCNRKKDCGDKDDDDNGQGGVSGSNGPSQATIIVPGTSSASNNQSSTEEGKSGDGRGGPSESCLTALMPIPEMHQLDSDRGEGIRARLMHRSHTAERIIRDWAGISPANRSAEAAWLGTPPRDSGPPSKAVELWIRKLQRARSAGDLREGYGSELSVEEMQSSFDDIIFDLSASSSEVPVDKNSDSGCSLELLSSHADFNMDDACCAKTKTYLNIDLLFDQPRCEKVNSWLRSSQFAF